MTQLTTSFLRALVKVLGRYLTSTDVHNKCVCLFVCFVLAGWASVSLSAVTGSSWKLLKSDRSITDFKKLLS